VVEFRHFIRLSVTDADNKHFESIARQGENNYTFFHIENGIMKALNEHFFRDRELSAASSSLMRQIVIALLREVGLNPVAVYADYKSLRLAFPKRVPNLKEKLRSVFFDAVQEFKNHFSRFDELKNLTLPPASLWHFAGIGNSADRASILARVGRKKNETFVVFDEKMEERLKKLAIRIEELRTQLVGKTNLKSLFIKNNGLTGFSEKAIYLLRKLTFNTSKIDLNLIRKSLKDTFDVTISEKEVVLLVEYLDLLNIFSPPIYEEYELPNLNLSGAKHGILIIDIRGQGARNLMSTARALALNSSLIGSIGNLLSAIRKEQDMESGLFLEKRFKAKNILEKYLVEGNFNGEIRISGDDAAFIPNKKLTTKEKISLTDKFKELGDVYRLSFIESNYIDTHEPLPINKFMDLLATAENIEKNLRFALSSESDLISNYTFGIEILPQANGINLVNLIIGGNPNSFIVTLIRNICRKIELPPSFIFSKILNLRLPPEEILKESYYVNRPMKLFAQIELNLESFLLSLLCVSTASYQKPVNPAFLSSS